MEFLIAIIAIALVFDFINGFHDAANSIATVVSTRVLRPHHAVMWAAFFNFVAFVIFPTGVAATIGKGVVTLVLVFTVFGWYYPARIVRSQVLSLREKEFVEAARMVGAGDWRIMRSHVLPHLVAPIVVVSTLIVAQYILAEAGLSFLGLGVKLPTASWGNLLADAPNFYTSQPWLMVWPGLAVLLTTLAFNLMGDGLRDAFDPRAAH